MTASLDNTRDDTRDTTRADTLDDSEDETLREQIAYYRARADEYDQWFLSQGRYDHGEQENARWPSDPSSRRWSWRLAPACGPSGSSGAASDSQR